MTIVQEIENLQIVFLILEDVKQKRLSVSKLSKEAGINAQKAYKWSERDSEISYADGIKILSWALKTDYSPKGWVAPGKRKETRFANLSEIEADLRKMADAIHKIDTRANSGNKGEAPQDSQEKNPLQRSPMARMEGFSDIDENHLIVNKQSRRGKSSETDK